MEDMTMDNVFKLDNLRVLREAKNFTQVKVSMDIGVSQELVSQWELGKSMPNPPALIKLADYFNCSVDFLLGRTDITIPISTLALDKNNIEYASIVELYKSLSADNRQHLTSYLTHLGSQTNE